MTREEFNTTNFINRDAVYKGKRVPIAMIDHSEGLIAIILPDSRLHDWKRCEDVELVSEPMKIVDIKDMPDYNANVKNGIDSVSKGAVTIKIDGKYSYPVCERHGAMLKVSKDGIWRCGEVSCSNGAYQVK